jgi:hypothetical protein
MVVMVSDHFKGFLNVSDDLKQGNQKIIYKIRSYNKVTVNNLGRSMSFDVTNVFRF